MPPSSRRWRPAAVLLAAAALATLAACNPAPFFPGPNSVFQPTTETNRDVIGLHSSLFFFGTLVFVFVEALLVYTIVKFRRKPGQAEPKHVHGNTTLEVLWTAIPAVILIFIAVPTVRTIFRTQAKARPGALQVEVIGHQWWWEFRYPELNITTANELYLPAGRTVNFALKTADVLHSFWIPGLSGKRDLIANHTNYLWFTPDSVGTGAAAWNGHCAEYCGASHGVMKFRVYTVTQDQFASWAKGQQQAAAYGAVAQAGTTSGPQTVGAPAAAAATAKQAAAGVRESGPRTGEQGLADEAAARNNPTPTQSASGAGAAGNPRGDVTPNTAAQQAQVAAAPVAGYTFPMAALPRHVLPATPIPGTLERRVNTALVGDPQRGLQKFNQVCIGCHYVNGNPVAIGKIAPNLTHFGSRNTLAAGLYPNDNKHLRAWLKNSREMKPGVTMPTLGAGEIDPLTKQKAVGLLLSDQDIANVAAYLQALK